MGGSVRTKHSKGFSIEKGLGWTVLYYEEMLNRG